MFQVILGPLQVISIPFRCSCSHKNSWRFKIYRQFHKHHFSNVLYLLFKWNQLLEEFQVTSHEKALNATLCFHVSPIMNSSCCVQQQEQNLAINLPMMFGCFSAFYIHMSSTSIFLCFQLTITLFLRGLWGSKARWCRPRSRTRWSGTRWSWTGSGTRRSGTRRF